ncbi:MAG: hypothetical protein AAF245_02555 [Pseudomonadota bacterium]
MPLTQKLRYVAIWLIVVAVVSVVFHFLTNSRGEFSPFDRAAPDEASINQMFASLLDPGHTITVNSC